MIKRILIALLLATSFANAQQLNSGGSSGGGGTPGGANTNVQFNNSGVFGGDGSFTYVTPGQLSVLLGTVTTNNKAINITGTWNAAGTTFDAPFFMNITDTASAPASLLFDIQKGGVSIWNIRKDGFLTSSLSGGGINLGLIPVPSNTGGCPVGTPCIYTQDFTNTCCTVGHWFFDNLWIVGTFGGGGAFNANFQLIQDNTNPFFTLSANAQTKWFNGNNIIGSTADLGLFRNAAGVLEVNNATPGTFAELKTRSLVTGGSTPTGTGSCPINTQLGGNTAGSFKANGACAAGTVILTFAFTAPVGWACDTHDLTTPTDLMNQTAYTTTTATFTGTMANADLVTFKCRAF